MAQLLLFKISEFIIQNIIQGFVLS